MVSGVASIDSSNRLYVNTGTVAPPETTSVPILTHGEVTGTDDTVTLIPNGEELFLIRLSAGSERDSVAGSVVELFYDPNGDGSVLEEIETIYVNGDSNQFQLSGSHIGDGANAIRMRRRRLGGGTKEISGKWEGYY